MVISFFLSEIAIVRPFVCLAVLSAALCLVPVSFVFILLEGVFNSASLEIWEITYGIVYQILWIGIFYYFAKKAFYKYIVMKGG